MDSSPKLSAAAGVLLGVVAAGAVPEAQAKEVQNAHAVSRARYAMVVEGGSNTRALTTAEREDRLVHQVLAPGSDRPGSQDYDVWLQVGKAPNGKQIFVEAPATGARVEDAGTLQGKVSLQCVVATPTAQRLSGQPCSPLAERGESCTYTVLPPLGRGSEKANCSADALEFYNDFADVVAGRTHDLGVDATEVPSKEAPEKTPEMPKVGSHVEAAFAADVWAGANQESFGAYSLGVAGEGSMIRPNLGVDALWMPAGTDHGPRFGLTTDFAFTGEGSGWDRSGLVAGWQQGPFTADLMGGLSGEPADGGKTALDGVPYFAGKISWARPLTHLPGQVMVGLEGGVDVFRAPIDPSDTYATVSVGWRGNGELHLPTIAAVSTPVVKQKPEAQEVPSTKMEAEPAHHLGRTLSAPPVFALSVPMSADAKKLTPELRAQEVIRLRSDMKKFADRLIYKGVVDSYQKLLGLGEPLLLEDHMIAFKAYRNIDMAEAYKAILRAHAMDPDGSNTEVRDALADLDQTFGYVSIDARKALVGEGFTVVTPPFPPLDRLVVAAATEALTSGSKHYEGFYPVSAQFTLGGETVTVLPYADEKNTQSFTATH